MTDQDIDLIANDGYRNAAGGIYATSVYEFARAIEKASRRAALEEAATAIKAEDDRMADEDYMLDSDDCIRVIRSLAEGDKQ